MSALRRILYWEAGLLAAFTILAEAFPRPVLEDLFGQSHQPDLAWVRIAGIQAFGFAMLMVLIAQRIEELWWFSWAFAVVAAGVATVTALNAAFGLPEGSSALFWWLMTAGEVAFTAALLWGMSLAGNEQPLD